MDCSPPGSSVHGILQARILEWCAIPFSRGSFQPRIKPGSPALQADSLPSEPPRKPWLELGPLLRNANSGQPHPRSTESESLELGLRDLYLNPFQMI